MKTIVVLGMHRSGTSLVAGLLHKAGVFMGEKLLPATKDNPKGYFEDIEFLELNEAVFAENGSTWETPAFGLWGIPNAPIHLLERMRLLVKERNEGHNIWGWKDPRTCLTVGLYWQFLREPYFIICYRNPLSIAKSLRYRDGLSIEHGLWLASVYNSALASCVSNTKCQTLYVSFESFFEDPSKQIGNLESFIGLPLWPKSVFTGFIEKELKHF